MTLTAVRRLLRELVHGHLPDRLAAGRGRGRKMAADSIEADQRQRGADVVELIGAIGDQVQIARRTGSAIRPTSRTIR